VTNGCEYSDLIECVLFLFGAQIHDFDSFECVEAIVLHSQSLVDCRIGSLA
jgi:hypothetical protein